MRASLLGLSLLATPALAQTPAISVETLKSVTQTLSSDAYEGRKPTTPAEDKTTAYIVAQFKAAGLKPGVDGGWFQKVPLVEITATNVSPLTITGGSAPLALAFRSDVVLKSYRVVPHIAIKDSDVVFVGYGINAPERGWNDYAGLDVKGKTVVILVNDPDWQSAARTGLFEGKAMTYYGRWT